MKPTEQHLRMIGKSELETMLNSSEVWALKEVAYLFSSEGTARNKAFKNKKSMIKFLQSAELDSDKIIEKLRELETHKPFQYVFFLKWHNSTLDSLSNLIIELLDSQSAIPTNSFPGYFNSYRISHAKKSPTSLVFTIEHEIETTRWENYGDTKKAFEFPVRHPLVFSIFSSGHMFISYPGVTKSRNHKESFESYYLILEFLQNLSDQIEISFNAYNVKSAVDVLFDLKSKNQVNFLNLRFGNMNGDVEMSSESHDLSVEDLLPALMVKHLPQVTEDEIRDSLIASLRECSIRQAHLFWKNEKVSTVFKYYEIGTQIAFIWKGTPPSYKSVLNIIKTLIRLSTIAIKEDNMLNVFLNAPKEKYFTFTDLKEKLQTDTQLITKELIDLHESEIIETIYRLKASNPLKTYSNIWTLSIAELRKEFEDINGDIISGLTDANIEVAFRLRTTPKKETNLSLRDKEEVDQ